LGNRGFIGLAASTFCLLLGGGCASLLGFDEPRARAGDPDASVTDDPDASVTDDPDATPGAPDAAVPDAAVPDARPPDSDAALDVSGSTCKDVLSRHPGSRSGNYTIDPDEGGPGAPFVVYCDLSDNGGGWTLVLAYSHTAGTNPPLQPGVPPQDPTDGFSHFSSAQLRFFPFDEVRFQCLSGAHNRFIDFRTSVGIATDYIRGANVTNAASAWNQFFQTDGDHDALLPAAATAVHNCPQTGVCGLEDRMTSKPFFSNDNHWSIGDQGAWACDDKSADGSRETLHQVWVR